MVIKQVHDSKKCDWCSKDDKECVEVELDSGKTAVLCWADLKRMAKMTLVPKAKV